MYKIMARPTSGDPRKGRQHWVGDPEQVDEADTLEEAKFLAWEYRMAFGPSFDIKIKEP